MRLSLPMGCGHCTESIADCCTLYQLGAKKHEKTSIIYDKLLLVLCFFIYLSTIIQHFWSGFGLALILAKKGVYVMAFVMVFLRCQIVMFVVVKFCAGLAIGFGQGVYFFLSLQMKKALIQRRLRTGSTARCAGT